MANLEAMVAEARVNVEAGRRVNADIFYRLILKDTDPPKTGLAKVARGEASLWFAREALFRGKYGTAADWYYDAINSDPLAVDYRIEMCVKCLIPMGLYKDALAEAMRAVRIEPNYSKVWRLLAGLHHKMGNNQESIAAYDRQIDLAPDDPQALLDRATIALDTADYDTVKRLCRWVLNTKLGADAVHCMAMTAYRESRHEEAIELYEQAIERGCYDPELARWNQSLALHAIGRYREGWVAHEARGRQKTDAGMARLMNRFQLPLFDNQPAPARVHVHQEMGFGDVIAMARYLPLLAEKGYDTRFEVDESMVALMQRSVPGINVMPRSADYPSALGIPAFDYHLPILSFPAVFGTDIDTVPWNGPYIKSDPELVEKYRAKLPTGKKLVGLCWSSGIRNDGVWMAEYGRRKSMHFETVKPLLDSDCTFVSLQVGPERKQINDPRIVDVLPENPNWSDTAALVECLDLVLTVDTSVSHLVGAMGKPVWVMMQYDGSSWHWLCKRDGASWNEANPWYPSARVFRQHEPNTPHQWGDVIRDVSSALGG